MHLRTTLLAAVACALAAPAARAQPGGLRDGAVAGVGFRVPQEFSPVPALSDRTVAVFEHAPTHAWVFVAPVRDPRERAAVIRRIANAIGTAALGPGGAAEWAGLPSDPISPFEEYRQRVALLGPRGTLDLTFRQYGVGTRQVVVGSAFLADDGSGPPAATCGEIHSYPATEAEAQLAASLRGETVALLGPGGPPIEGGPPPGAALDPAQEQVRSLFHVYLKAVMQHDGAGVAAISAPAVVEYYAEMRRLALYAGPEQVRALPLDDRFEVLRLRHTLDAGKLRLMSPRDVLAADLETMETDGTAGSSVPRVQGDVATVELTWDGKPSGAQMAFVRREGAWKIDFLAMLSSAACGMRTELRASGVGPADENGVLLLALGRVTGRPASPDIWQPLVPAEPRPE